MKTRLFGAALATALLLLPGWAWAQHGGRASGGHGRGQTPSSGGAGSRAERPRGEAAPRTTVLIAPRVVPARPFFARPYYVFQPRAGLGFGLFLGYPVAYPQFYLYPNAYLSPYPSYPYASPTLTYPYSSTPIPTYPYTSRTPTYPNASPVYGSPALDPNAVTVAPGSQNPPPSTAVGGVSFQMSPGEAAVFVDGVYVGTANDFSASTAPLSLAAGRHHFELRAQGYQTMALDVDVMPGQVIPYQGTLQPAQP